MSIFNLYFNIGLEHITDIVGYDHILFLITLVSVYSLSQWKQILVLITAFTIGHSITLALAIFDLYSIKIAYVEIMIAFTILVTSLLNLLQKSTNVSKLFHYFKYCLALLFGLIHGMGFSNYLRSLLGSESNIFKPLLAFNLGLELGQLIIVVIVMILALVFYKLFKVKPRDWNLVFSGAGIGISIILLIERFKLL